MKPFLQTLILAFLALVAPAVAHATAAPQSTATLTPSSSYLLPTANQVTFTAAVAGYPGTTSAIGWTVTLPAGWAYVSGTGEPGVKPTAGQTGTLEWAYIAIPHSATFTFTVSHPAGITADKSVSSAVIVRYAGVREDVTPTAVTLQPATAPVVTNTGTTTATFASTLSLGITATSPIPITGYSATGLPTGLTLDGVTGLITGAPTQVGTFTVQLTATNAAGTSTAAPITLTVANANATVTLGSLAQTYNGTPRAATATTTPTGLTVSLLYGSPGSATAPADAGTYPVSASVTSTGYTATASGSLVIAPAAQTVTFAPVGTVTPGNTYPLSAITTAALPVTFSVVSGPASISGTTLTVNGAGAIVLRASQAGTANYLAATADQTLSASKVNQSITFAQPPDKLATDGSFTLTATASSGLPVSLTLVSGPAFLSGSTVTLTGAAGTVLIRATQAGNATYNAAPDVTRSLAVTADRDRVFFGDFFSAAATGNRKNAAAVTLVGDVAAVLPAHSNTGTLMIVAPTVGVNTVVSFTLQPDGHFVALSPQTISGTSQTITVRGQIAGTLLTGSIDGLGFTFSTAVDPESGPSAPAAGYYESTGLSTATATTYTIVGTNNDVLVLAFTPTLTVGGPATLLPNGSFQLDVPAAGTAPAVTLKGAVDTPTTTVSGTILVAQQPPVDLAGLKNTTSRTDRLINLSSRAKVGPGEKLLITGLIIGGTTPKPVLVRAVGPGLTHLGVNGVLTNPKIKIERQPGGALVAENDDWGSAADPAAITSATSRIGAFPLAAGSTDAALLTTLQPGIYTVQVTASGTTTQDGVALAEIYDASENPSADYQRLVNISSRGEVTSGENVLIGGFIITGNSPKRVLIRGAGPGLAALSVSNPLADPLLKIYQGNTLLATNDNWSTDATAAAELTTATASLGAFALTPGSKDAAIILNLAPGYYTAHVLSASAASGIALIEIYEIPE